MKYDDTWQFNGEFLNAFLNGIRYGRRGVVARCMRDYAKTPACT